MSGPDLPAPIATLARELADVPGALAIVLGGSRATGEHREDSDWDLGVYYRARHPLDPENVRRLGHRGYVSDLGEWGPIVNGGAWLTIEGLPVDVLFRDLDVIEGWLDEARHGRFGVLAQNGYLVGAPTYLPLGELATARPVAGKVPCPEFPPPLARAAAKHWVNQASVALMFATGHARSGDVVCCVGMLSHAILCSAHSRLAARREWVLNEKRLVERADLHETGSLLAEPGCSVAELVATVVAVSATLEVEPLTAR